MKITYDSKYNIAYVYFREKKENVNTIKISEELVIDIAPDGKIYGIELLNANEQINSLEKGKLTFINQISGEIQEYHLPI